MKNARKGSEFQTLKQARPFGNTNIVLVELFEQNATTNVIGLRTRMFKPNFMFRFKSTDLHRKPG